MWRTLTLSLVLLVSVCTHFFVTQEMWQNRGRLRRTADAGYVLPSKFSSVLALGYKGLLSDYLFLKVVTFFGDRHIAKRALSDDDWEFLVTGLDVVTDLDPYFEDPYIFAEGNLAWEGRVEEANLILKKGLKYRNWDWRIPYYIGFNYFYFLQDYEKGAEYVMEAASRPGSHPFLSTLGARLAYYGGKSKTAVLFLRQMILETTDPGLRTRLKKRLVALERAAELEAKIDLFVKEQGRKPAGIEELITAGYVDSLPPDPYGGQWVILKNDRVFSTSKFTDSR
jgi:tetratricopeptide (TPR) repeat protein